MTEGLIIPVPELTGYHVPYLLAAEAGELHYKPEHYPIHGVPNNALACLWGGLLADGERGLVLTDDGARRLAEWKSSPTGRACLASQLADGDDQEQPHQRLEALAPVSGVGDCGTQLDLFGAVTPR